MPRVVSRASRADKTRPGAKSANAIRLRQGSCAGVPGLDDILGGGLVKGGLYLIEGMAGAGKTTLSDQDADTRT